MYFNLLTTISFACVKPIHLFDGFYLILAICYLSLMLFFACFVRHKKPHKLHPTYGVISYKSFL